MTKIKPLLPFLGVLAGGVVSILISKLAGIALVLWARTWPIASADAAARELALVYSIAIAIAAFASIVAGMVCARIGKRFEALCGALASWASLLSIVGTSQTVTAAGVTLSTPLFVCCIVFSPIFGALGALMDRRLRVGVVG